MALSNNLKKQVDLPVWEWCRLAPAISSALSSTTAADNSLYHVTFGRYIYYHQSNVTLATSTGLTGFFRYDTITDSYQLLAQPTVQSLVYSAMQFAGDRGYDGIVLGSGPGLNTLQIAALTGQTLKGFDIRITAGTGIGQLRVITGASDPVIWDNGTASAVGVTPQTNITDNQKNWTLNQWVGYQVRFVSATGQSQTRKVIYNSSNTLYWADVNKFAEDTNVDSPVVSIGGSAEVIAAIGSLYQIESSVITVDSNWSVIPDATSRFTVRGGGIWLVSSSIANYGLQYYDILADQWYIRNGASATTPVQVVGTEACVTNSGETTSVFVRGTATGTQSTTTLQDTTKNWTTNQWANYSVRIWSGTGENQWRNIISNTNNTLTVSAWTTITPDATTQYFIEAFEMGTVTYSTPRPAAATTLSVVSGVSGANTVTFATATPVNCNGWYVSGTGITPGTTVSSGQGTKILTLSANNASTVSGLLILAPSSVSATASGGSINTFTVTTSSATPANCNGWYISGTNIGVAAVIVAGQGTTTLTLSVVNTGTVSGTLSLYPVTPTTPNVFTTAISGSSGTTITTTLTTPANCNGWYISGPGVADYAIVTAGQGTTSLTVSATGGAYSGAGVISPTITAGAASSGTIGTTSVTMASATPAFCNGWYVSGTGIAPGAYVVSGQGTTGLTLSANNTSAVSGTLTFSVTTVTTGAINGSVLTAGTTAGNLYPGQVLLGLGSSTGAVNVGSGIQQLNTIISAPAECYTIGAVTTVNFAVSNPITLGIQVGMMVSINSIVGLPGQAGSGTLAAAATGPSYVTAVSTNSVTLSTAVATALVNVTLQFITSWVSTNAAHTSSGNLVTLTSGNTTGLFSGMYLFIGGGLTGTVNPGTYVAQVIDATHFTVAPSIATVLGGTGWLYAQPYQSTIVNQLSGVPGGAGTYTVYPSQIVPSTTIIATGTQTITDSTQSWLANRWTNYMVRIKSGTGVGQYRQILGTVSNGAVAYTSAAGATSVASTITVTSTTNLSVNMQLNVTAGTGAFAYGTYVQSITNSTTFIASAAPTTPLSGGATVVTGTPINTLVVYPPWKILPDSTSVYSITGDSDKLYMSFGAATQGATYFHNIDADLVTTGRQLERGVARGVVAQYGDYEPVAVTTGIPVLPVVSGTGYGTTVATTAGSVASNLATVTFSTAAASTPFPIGSWVTIAGTTSTGNPYNGTWQVVGSGVGTVSFYTLSTTGTISAQGTIVQANSFNLALGTLGSGNWAQFENGTTITGTGNVPTTYNGALTVAAGVAAGTALTFGGYQVTGISGAGPTYTVSSTAGLVVGALPTITAGSGTLAPNTFISAIVANTSFTLSATPIGSLTGATITVTPSIATTATTTVGNLTALGVIQKNPLAPTAISGNGTTATVSTVGIGFPVGSWIVITGTAGTSGVGTYNGIYQVTGGTPGTNVQFASTCTNNAATLGLIGIATQTQLVTTANNHNFQTGQIVVHKGDLGWSAAVNNIAAPITVMTPAAGTAATQYIYSVGQPAAQMVVYTYSATVFNTLFDGSKNWTPNQWAGCQISWNSIQITNVAIPVQANILSAYILSNTANTIIFAQPTAALSVTAGLSRYVITPPATFGVSNCVGAQDAGLMIGNGINATTIVDVTKSWIMPVPITGVAGSAISGTSVTIAATTGLYVGMTVAITLGNNALPLGTVINTMTQSGANTIITVSGTGFTTTNNATLTFAATASSSGNTVTVTGYPLTNLAPGMKLAMTAVTNLSPYVITTGAFVLNAGANFTPVTVVSITGTNTFTVSQTPAVPLQNATVQATFWVPGQWINRRLRITSGVMGANILEAVVSASTVNSLTIATITQVPVSGQYGYAILQQPARGPGTYLKYNYGASNPLTIGRYLYQARGGTLAGWDRIDLTTDKWQFLMPTPSYEPLAMGAMYAYDGGDRIYFTVQITQRMYYLDIENNQIHPAGMYPYVAGTAIVGNRMEIFTTVDGLKYLWLNRHSFQECFRQLLFY